jgi:hypothetical protein
MVNRKPVRAGQKTKRSPVSLIGPGIIHQNRGITRSITDYAANYDYMLISTVACVKAGTQPNKKYRGLRSDNIRKSVGRQRGGYWNPRKAI